jgi:tRNA pseudouridine55 synthase
MYSAVKIGGQRLYEIARRGGEIERPARRITVHSAEIISGEGCEYVLRFRVSKGTYIRTLCHDVGEYLGVGAAMSSLVRTRAGAYTLGESATLAEIEQRTRAFALGGLLLPLDSMFASLPRVTANADLEHITRHGGNCHIPEMPDGDYRLYSTNDEFLALITAIAGNICCKKSFCEV